MEIKIVIDDRIVDLGKKLASKRTLAIMALLSVAVPVVLYADNLNVFQGGEPISASAVNQNFANLDGRVGAYEAAVSVDENGNVGVGAEDPMADLSVHGNLSQPLTGTVGVNGGSDVVYGTGTHFTEELNEGDAILIDGFAYSVVSIESDRQLTIDPPAISDAADVTAYTDSDLFAVQSGDGVDRFVIDKSGNVGIGTRTPAAKFHVAGVIQEGNFTIGEKLQYIACLSSSAAMGLSGRVAAIFVNDGINTATCDTICASKEKSCFAAFYSAHGSKGATEPDEEILDDLGHPAGCDYSWPYGRTCCCY